MGQTISRQLAGRLDKSMARYRQLMREDALKDVADKQRQAAAASSAFTDPNAAHGGFQRGQGPQELHKDVQQETFLEQQHGGKQQSHNTELPQDLINFLNDVGPLQRKVDKEFTSPRLRQKLQKELDHPEEDPHRQLRDMPIMEDVDFSTTRTTNFSSLQQDDETKGRLTHEDIHKLLLQGGMDNSDTNLESYLSHDLKKEEREEQWQLMQHTIKYLSVPVLMKETNENIIGTHKDRVSEMERVYKLKVVPQDHIRLIVGTEEFENDANKSAKEKSET